MATTTQNPQPQSEEHIRELVRLEVIETLSEGPTSKAIRFDLVKFVGGITLALSGLIGSVAVYLMNDVASDTASEVAKAHATEIAGDIAREIAAKEARETATYIRATAVVDTLLANPSFAEEVSAGLSDSLSGAVLAFDLESGCPAGWTPFREASGRMLIGAVSAEDLKSIPHGFDKDESRQGLSERPFRLPGGEEKVTLLESQVPAHDHDTIIFRHDGDRRGWAGNSLSSMDLIAVEGKTKSGVRSFTTSNAGGLPDGTTESHNNMPPYIALYFCKKN